LAEVVLPAASFAEADGSYTNLTGRVQAVHAAKRPPGQARDDCWIIAQIARRTSEVMASARGTAKEKPARVWDLVEPAQVWAEISRVLPGYQGSDHGANVGEMGWQPPAAPKVARRAFKRVEAESPPRDPDYPLALAVVRRLYDRGTLLRYSERVQRLVPRALVIVHPEDARRFNLADGDPVSVVSAQGQLELEVRVSNTVVPGVVVAPSNLSDAPLSTLYSEPLNATSTWPLAFVRLVK
jgi:anaerobic selenocysteine-containing dehydrogenase